MTAPTTESKPSYWTEIPAPFGRLRLGGTSAALTSLHIVGGPHDRGPRVGGKRDRGPFRAAIEQLNAYLAGDLRKLDIPFELEGPPFHRLVWEALLGVEYGRTASYGDIARAIGRPRAARAVGRANALNPISIVVPCHRVVGSDGRLTGYGGGLKAKRWLLEHEASARGDDAGC